MGVQSVQLGSLHSASLVSRRSRVMVGRRWWAGRCGFDDTEAVRESGFWVWRGLLSLLWWRASPATFVCRRALGAGLWETGGAAVTGTAGGLREEALGAESAELFEAAVMLEYPESLRMSLLGASFSRTGAFSALRSLERLVLTLACAVGEERRGKVSVVTGRLSLSSEW